MPRINLVFLLTQEEFDCLVAALAEPQPDTPKFDKLFARKSRFPKPECE